jgi:hypothetical protein
LPAGASTGSEAIQRDGDASDKGSPCRSPITSSTAPCGGAPAKGNRCRWTDAAPGGCWPAVSYATQINFDKKNNAIELENYSSEPVRLNNLELEVRK